MTIVRNSVPGTAVVYCLLLIIIALGLLLFRANNKINDLNKYHSGALVLAKQQVGQNNSTRKLVSPSFIEEGHRISNFFKQPNDESMASSDSQRVDTWLSILDSPRFMELEAAHNRALVEIRYGIFAERINMSPEKKEEFLRLCIDTRQLEMDTAIAWLQKGLDPIKHLDAFAEEVSQSKLELNNKMHRLLGSQACKEYIEFEISSHQVRLNDKIQVTLHSAGAGMSESQTKELADLLTKNKVIRLNDKVIESAEKFLSASQIRTLKAMREESKARESKEMFASALFKAVYNTEIKK